MSIQSIVCARCTEPNHPSTRFCAGCGLPLGSTEPDVEAASEALGPYEAPDPADPDTSRAVKSIVDRAGFSASPSGHGWRLDVPLQHGRKQAVYLGHVGTDSGGRAILALVSVCGPTDTRDARSLLMLNARVVDGHFAIRVLRGEEYYVVIHNLPAHLAEQVEAPAMVRSIAELADGLEDRLTRGKDLY